MWSALEQFRLSPQSGTQVLVCIAAMTAFTCIVIISRDRRWKPACQEAEKAPTQRLDGLCVIAIALPTILLCLYSQANSDFVPELFRSSTGPATRSLLRYHFIYALLGLCIAALVAAKIGTSRAVVLIGIALCIGGADWNANRKTASSLVTRRVSEGFFVTRSLAYGRVDLM